MSEETRFEVGGYVLDARYAYHPESHLWVDRARPDRWRIGLDPLGAETSGDIVAVSFEPAGGVLAPGDPFGSLEAAKFVGPLAAPISGTLVAHNPEVLARPALLNQDPLRHWLVELAPGAGASTAGLLAGRDAVERWFAAEIERVKRDGLVAE